MAQSIIPPLKTEVTLLDKFENINQLLAEQARLNEDFAKEVAVLKNDDLTVENRRLTALVAELEALKAQMAEQNAHITGENRRLKNELFEQLFNERATLIDRAENRVHAYFATEAAEEGNKLALLERRLNESMANMKKQMQTARVEEENSIFPRLDELHAAVQAEIADMRRRNEEAERLLYAEKKENFEKLKDEPLTDDAIVRRSKQNNWESLLGLKVFNKLGITLIIISVIAAALFPNEIIPDTLRGILMFALGMTMLVFGELINRKKPDVFSLGLTSGGVAVLYAGTALSFFLLQIIGMYPALILCVLITTAALVLAGRYNSQTVAAFALIGGYLPLISVADDGTLIYFAAGYFVILNIFSLSVACIRKWHAAQFIGFFLNLFATGYVTTQLYEAQYAWSDVPGQGTALPVVVGLVYVFFSFVVYTVIPLVSSYLNKKRLTVADNLLLSLNTFFGSVSILAAFYAFNLWDWAGVLAIGLGVFYLLATKLVEKIMEEEIASRMLLCITGLTFAVLVIPIQFGVADLSLGWLIEGVLLLSYGLLSEKKLFRVFGTIISVMCLLTFFFYDLTTYMWSFNSHFYYKYLFITLGSLLVFGVALYKKLIQKSGGGFFQCAVIVNLWFFLMFTIYDKLSDLLIWGSFDSYNAVSNCINAFAVIVTLFFAYGLARWRLIAGRSVRFLSTLMYIGSLLRLIVLNADWVNSSYSIVPTGISFVITLLMLVLTNLLAVLAMRQLLTRLILHRKLSVEWYPLGLSAFFVFLLLENLVVQLNLRASSVIVTVIFALTALGWVVFGFMRRYQYLRLFGLGLSFVTAIKLFIVDLSYLGQGMRIISYFSLGIVLLAISFVYQYFNKRLDRVSEGAPISLTDAAPAPDDREDEL